MHVGELSTTRIIFSRLKQGENPISSWDSHGQTQPHAAVPLSSHLLSRGKSCWMEKCMGKQLPQLREAADPGLSSPLTHFFHFWLCTSSDLLSSALCTTSLQAAWQEGSQEGLSLPPTSTWEFQPPQ